MGHAAKSVTKLFQEEGGKELFSIKDLGMSVDILRKQPQGTADKTPRNVTKGTVTQMHSIFTGWPAANFSRLMSDVMLSSIWVSANYQLQQLTLLQSIF